jgi:hypothetical protein
MKIRIIDIIYYMISPKSLFEEALSYLHLTESELYTYAAVQTNTERYELLLLATLNRMTDAEGQRKHYGLFKHLAILGWVKGWL